MRDFRQKKTTRITEALKRYSVETCLKAYATHICGEGAYMIGDMCRLADDTASDLVIGDRVIDAGRFYSQQQEQGC